MLAPAMSVRHLPLIRHAKSSWDDDRLGDFERPLNKRGQRDALESWRSGSPVNCLPTATRDWSRARRCEP